jgi:hypothetical protein
VRRSNKTHLAAIEGYLGIIMSPSIIKTYLPIHSRKNILIININSGVTGAV